MQQTSSSSKVKHEPTKTKKLHSSRNMIAQRQGPKPITRLKSTHEVSESNQNLPAKTMVKPRSSMGKRPVSSKQTETMNSMATTSSAKSEGQVKQMIHTVFAHSKKIQNFLSQNQLDEQSTLGNLLNNELFTLSLITMLANKNHEQSNRYIETSCINKLQRTMAMDRQINICSDIQCRISKLIDGRIKALKS